MWQDPREPVPLMTTADSASSYRNLDKITRIAPTLDTHQALQIFQGISLVDDEGRHPAPLTTVSYEDIGATVWPGRFRVC